MPTRLLVSLTAAAMLLTTPAALAAPGDPGEPVRLNGDLPRRVDFAKCDTPNLWFSPDGGWVVYRQREEHRDIGDLFAVRVDGAGHHRVNVAVDPHDGVGFFGFGGNGSTIVYLVPVDEDRVRLLTTPLAGGPSTELVGPVELRDALLTPDGDTLVYLVEGDSVFDAELFTVPVTGGPATAHGVITRYDHSTAVEVTPDGSRLVFGRSVPGGPFLFRTVLYALPLAGGPMVELSLPIGADGDVQGRSWQIAPDSSHVVAVADRNLGDDDVLELFSAPLDGGPGARLTRLFPAGGGLKDYLIAPDSSRVVYRGDQRTDKQRELFSVPIGGGTRTRLSMDLPEKGDVSFFSISPDSTTVLYRADQHRNNRHELFAVPLAGGDPVRLNSDLPDGGDVKRDQWTPGCSTSGPWAPSQGISADSTTVVYTADQEVDGKRELYAVPIGGGSPVKLSPPLRRTRDVKKFQISPDSGRVMYVADQDTNNMRELYSVSIGGGASTKLSGPFPDNGDVMTVVRFSPGGDRVIYIADQLTGNVRELFSVEPA